jgi:hypothetical protein
LRLFLSTLLLGLTAFTAPAHAVLEDHPSIKLQGLDKSVGRTITFEAKVGSTIQYGPLFIKIHACRKAPPIETPESAAFLQIWEVPPGSDKSEWVFSGWMFASSPALSAMDHPVYDVWVLDCTGKEEPNEEAAAAESNEQADQTDLPKSDAEAAERALQDDADAATDSEVPPADTENDETGVPVDSEAQMDDPTSIVPQDAPVYDPNAPYSPSNYPSAPAPTSQYPNPVDAPYNPPHPQPQEQPQYQGEYPYAPAELQQEGIYSPSQGRVIPVQPSVPYPAN